VDGEGKAYVSGHDSQNAFKITAGGVITEIIDASGDGAHDLGFPHDIAVDSAGNVFVAGSTSDNAFKITAGGVITEIIDGSGDGNSGLVGPVGVAVSSLGHVYVTGMTATTSSRWPFLSQALSFQAWRRLVRWPLSQGAVARESCADLEVSDPALPSGWPSWDIRLVDQANIDTAEDAARLVGSALLTEVFRSERASPGEVIVAIRPE
jgi:hypothetical protein